VSREAPRAKGSAHRNLGQRLGLIAGFALTLPGCPLSDGYYVDATLGRGGSAGPGAGKGGVAPPAGGKSGMGGPGDGKGGKGGAGGAVGAGTGNGGKAADCEPEPEVCDGVSNDCDDQIDEDGVCPMHCTARLRDGETYLLCLPPAPERLEHLAAGMLCASFEDQAGVSIPSGMEFVAIQSEEENDFVKGWLEDATPENGLVWMGATDVRDESIWVWGRGVDVEVQFFTGNGHGGTPYMGAYADFASGEPHGETAADGIDCAAFDSSVGWQWVDTDCLQKVMGFMCESGP
jgi:hypothetical protein